MGFVRVFPDAPAMAVETVLKERLMVAINRDNELSRHREIALRAFVDQPLILFPSSPRPSLGDHIVALCNRAGFTPRVVQEVEDVVTSIALVSSGFGICVVPECATSLRLPARRPLADPAILPRSGAPVPQRQRIVGLTAMVAAKNTRCSSTHKMALNLAPFARWARCRQAGFAPLSFVGQR